jgi:hypothetical protein
MKCNSLRMEAILVVRSLPGNTKTKCAPLMGKLEIKVPQSHVWSHVCFQNHFSTYPCGTDFVCFRKGTRKVLVLYGLRSGLRNLNITKRLIDQKMVCCRIRKINRHAWSRAWRVLFVSWKYINSTNLPSSGKSQHSLATLSMAKK